jgi:transposase InsO family protein
MGRTGSSYDNAVAESFFGTLKNEWFHHEKLLDAATTKCLTIDFIESYYNRFRPHETIDNHVPARLMEEFFQRMDAAQEYEGTVEKAA